MPQLILHEDPETGLLAVSTFIEGGGFPSIEEAARATVPPGVPYLITTDESLPACRTFRAAWEADFSEPHGKGADYGTGSTVAIVAWNDDGTPVTEPNDQVKAWQAEQEAAAQEAEAARIAAQKAEDEKNAALYTEMVAAIAAEKEKQKIEEEWQQLKAAAAEEEHSDND